MNKFIIIILSLVLLPFLIDDVSADFNKCEIRSISDGCDVGYDLVGNVTVDGHFSTEDVGLNHLCCPDQYTFGSGSVQWLWNHNDGQGHVYALGQNSTSMSFNMSFTFEDSAEVLPIDVNLSNTLSDDQLCFFTMSTNTSAGAHIGPCGDHPGSSLAEDDFDFVLATTPTEICYNSIDDTGDGNIDCASPQCHPTLPDNTPSVCTGNNQTTADCIDDDGNLKDHCRNNQTGDYFYCSYGFDDDNTTDLDGNPDLNADGYCCPSGQVAEADPITGEVECVDFAQCYIESSSSDCDFDHMTEFGDWLDYEYDSSNPFPEEDWCVSARPDYFLFETGVDDRSDACCEIEKFGSTGYYFGGDNIEVYG